MSRFIGRGENRVKQILERLFPDCNVHQQIPLQNLIAYGDYCQLDEVYRKHKIDLVIVKKQIPEAIAAIEVNYKHGNIASRKWTNIFKPLLQNVGVLAIPIHDYECKSLFNTKDERPLKWEDFEDVITALKMGGAKP